MTLRNLYSFDNFSAVQVRREMASEDGDITAKS